MRNAVKPLTVLRNRGAGGSPLLSGHVSCVPMDESSDGSAPVQRSDIVGTNHFADDNNSPSAVGLNGNCVSVDALRTLTCLNNATIQGGAGVSFTYSLLIKQATIAYGIPFGKTLDYYIVTYADGRVQWNVRKLDNSGTATITLPAGSLTANAWDHVVCGYDAAQDKSFISLNGAAIVYSSTTLGGGVYVGSNDLYLSNAYGASYYPGGLIDELNLWSRAITQAEITTLYNGGLVLPYPF